MRTFRTPRFSTPILAALLAGCAGSPPPAGRPVEPATAQAAVTAGGGATIEAALDHALDVGDWSDLLLDAECNRGEGLERVRLFGNGVGVWRERRQFRVEEAEVRGVLRSLLEDDFAALEERYGGKDDPVRTENAALRVICRMDVLLGGAEKRVVQFDGGRQSAELAAIAGGVIDRLRSRGEAGETAESLADGLSKVADGRLAPVTLTITVHRLHDAPGAGDGWLLRLEGTVATLRERHPTEGYGDARVMELSRPDLSELSRALAAGEPDSLPGNLWSEHYTDFSVSVLGREKRLQARQFAQMTRETHGASQLRYERMIERFETLRDQILHHAGS